MNEQNQQKLFSAILITVGIALFLVGLYLILGGQL